MGYVPVVNRKTSSCAGVAAGLLALLLTGCSGAAEQEAGAAAVAFAADPATACDRLAPETAKALAQEGTDCGEAMAGFSGGDTAVLQVEVAGESAFVRLPDQVVFLARFPLGWLVTAAGCVREDADPAAPYDCEVHP